MSALADNWLRTWKRASAPTLRIVCLPHAGGAASFFRGFASELPAGVELLAVQYPGREDRVAEPLLDDMAVLVDALIPCLVTLQDVPLVLFGHSLGACVSYELASRLEECAAGPSRLVVSGRPSPAISSGTRIHERDELGIVEELVRIGGAARVLLGDADLRALVIPAVRADYLMDEHYRLREKPRVLCCPITALVGDADPEASAWQMRDWRRFTTGGFALSVLAGGHFYLSSQRRAVARELVRGMPTSVAQTWPSTP